MQAMLRSPLFCLILIAQAQLTGQNDAEILQQQFARMDQNDDKVVDRREFAGSDRQFELIDKDRNGKATFEEYKASPIAAAFLRARYRNKQEPRERKTAAEVAAARLESLDLYDTNRDGKITRAEWRGTNHAFLQLDFDGNDVIDRKDRTEALAAAPGLKPALPDFRRPVPDIALLFKRFDKDSDKRLTARELRSQKDVVAALSFADRDQDGALDERELQYLSQAVARRQNRASGGRPQPYQVPFDTWDKDDDEKVRQNEWQGSRSLFEQIDLDRDAAVSRDEVARYEKRVKGDDFLERFDLDGNGRVTPEEFAGPPAAFRRMDKNGDGAITRADR